MRYIIRMDNIYENWIRIRIASRRYVIRIELHVIDICKMSYMRAKYGIASRIMLLHFERKPFGS